MTDPEDDGPRTIMVDPAFLPGGARFAEALNAPAPTPRDLAGAPADRMPLAVPAAGTTVHLAAGSSAPARGTARPAKHTPVAPAPRQASARSAAPPAAAQTQLSAALPAQPPSTAPAGHNWPAVPARIAYPKNAAPLLPVRPIDPGVDPEASLTGVLLGADNSKPLPPTRSRGPVIALAVGLLLVILISIGIAMVAGDGTSSFLRSVLGMH